MQYHGLRHSTGDGCTHQVSGLRWQARSGFGMLVLPFLRLVQVRVNRGESGAEFLPGFDSGTRVAEAEPVPLPVLDTRARDAVFYEHSVGSIINPPEST